MCDDEPGVPKGFRGKFVHEIEPQSIDEYSRNITKAIEECSRASFPDGAPVIERVDASSLSREDFLSEYGRRGLPVVLTNAMEGWDPEVWSSPERLSEAYGSDTPWTARRGRSYEEMESVETTLPAYLQG